MGSDDLKKYCVYLITNMVNGKQYAGQTCRTPQERWRSHQKEARYGSKRIFCRALRKHGPEKFSLVVLREGLNKPEADYEETLAIRVLGLMDRGTGYNQTAGGEGASGLIVSEQTKEKLRNYASDMSPEHREKLSQARIGMKFSEETCEKLSKLRKGLPKSEAHKQELRRVSLGVPLSEEHKRHISAGHQNRSVEYRKKLSEAQKRKDIDESEVVRLHQEGRKLNAIRKTLNCNWKTVRRILREAGAIQ